MAGQLTIDTLKASSGVLATQNGMTGIAKAWVNFAGASGSVNASFNVSSVTRSGAGTYTVNFTTAMPNANYVIATSCYGTGGAWATYYGSSYGSAPSTTAVSFATGYTNGSFDATSASLAVFGN